MALMGWPMSLGVVGVSCGCGGRITGCRLRLRVVGLIVRCRSVGCRWRTGFRRVAGWRCCGVTRELV